MLIKNSVYLSNKFSHWNFFIILRLGWTLLFLSTLYLNKVSIAHILFLPMRMSAKIDGQYNRTARCAKTSNISETLARTSQRWKSVACIHTRKDRDRLCENIFYLKCNLNIYNIHVHTLKAKAFPPIVLLIEILKWLFYKEKICQSGMLARVKTQSAQNRSDVRIRNNNRHTQLVLKGHLWSSPCVCKIQTSLS